MSGIYYDPYEPREMIIDSFVQRGTIFLFISLIFFGVAIINGLIAVILYYM